jgi:hypothetical protein
LSTMEFLCRKCGAKAAHILVLSGDPAKGAFVICLGCDYILLCDDNAVAA